MILRRENGRKEQKLRQHVALNSTRYEAGENPSTPFITPP